MMIKSVGTSPLKNRSNATKPLLAIASGPNPSRNTQETDTAQTERMKVVKISKYPKKNL